MCPSKNIRSYLIAICGSIILAFGMYNIHAQSNITEGGILGITLFLKNVFQISPAVSTLLLDSISYTIAFKMLGKNFLIMSVISTFSYSTAYKILEQFPPIMPDLSNNLLLAAILGGVFVGVGVGLIVRMGGASGGDDALALAGSTFFKCKISRVYLISDLLVLALSLTYIPIKQIIFSLISVIISSNCIGIIQSYNKGRASVSKPIEE